MEPSGLQYVLERLRQISPEDAQRILEEEEREYAANSFRRALNETEIYYGTRRAENGRDRDKEEQLSRMWTDVAREIRPFDGELSYRCEIKGRYWADPIGWPEDAAIEYQITIQEMRDALGELLGQRQN